MHHPLATFALASGLALFGPAASMPLTCYAFVGVSGGEPYGVQSDSHAVRGLVKAISQDTLTITRWNRQHDVMTFVLNSATVRTGTIAVGSRVSIRFRLEGDTRVATAVTVRDEPARDH